MAHDVCREVRNRDSRLIVASRQGAFLRESAERIAPVCYAEVSGQPNREWLGGTGLPVLFPFLFRCKSPGS